VTKLMRRSRVGTHERSPDSPTFLGFAVGTVRMPAYNYSLAPFFDVNLRTTAFSASTARKTKIPIPIGKNH